jgi:hypothetical protein
MPMRESSEWGCVWRLCVYDWLSRHAGCADLVENCKQTAGDLEPAVQSIVDALSAEHAVLEATLQRPHTAEELIPIQARRSDVCSTWQKLSVADPFFWSPHHHGESVNAHVNASRARFARNLSALPSGGSMQYACDGLDWTARCLQP